MWKLYRIDVTPEELIKKCPSADRCKAIACNTRKIYSGIWVMGYDVDMSFKIIDPQEKDWAYTSDTSGWRLKWSYCFEGPQ